MHACRSTLEDPTDDLLQAGWKDVAVGDNSLEQAISSLRRALGTNPTGSSFIDTVARRGYRFGVPVARGVERQSDADLDALLAPHRAFVEGRAALETLQRDEIAHAREVFETALRSVPELASAHVGLANACVLQFETTRTDPSPDIRALATAVDHAREACKLDPDFAEAWATLGFVLDRTGQRVDALAAAKRAVSLEPDNWRHFLRLAYVSWGEERLRAARRTLALLPGFPLAHWLAATVYVARQALGDAERELNLALGHDAGPEKRDERFGSVALHWLLGLLYLARGDEAAALEELERELSSLPVDHLYARECASNTWYAIGALKLRQENKKDASAAFEQALQRVPLHPMAGAALTALGSARPTPPLTSSVDVAMVRAAQQVIEGNHSAAAGLVEHALTDAPAGNAAWVLPVEPLLQTAAHPDVWAGALTLVRRRAA